MAGACRQAMQHGDSEVASQSALGRPITFKTSARRSSSVDGTCCPGSCGCLPCLPQHPRPEAAAAAEARAASAEQKVARLEELAHTLQREVAAKGAALARMEEQARLGGEGRRSFVQARVASMRGSLRRQ